MLFRSQRAERLKNLSEIANGGTDAAVTKAYNAWATMKVPVDARDMYNEYISILENSAAETIKLSTEDANAIINNKWTWAEAAKLTNSTYFKGF